MKKALKLLLPILAIALLVSALCIFAAAAEETVPEGATFKITDKNGNVTYYTDSGLNAVTTLTDCTVDLLTDVNFSTALEGGSLSTSSIQMRGDVTINFNGHTLSSNKYLADSSRFSLYTGTSSNKYTGPWNITFNGGSSATDGVMGYFDGKSINGQKVYIDDSGKGATVTINNLVCSSSTTHSFFDFRGGYINLNNCTFNQNADSIFITTAGSAGSRAYITLDGCTFNGNPTGTTYLFQQGRSGSTNTVASLTVKNSVFNLYGTGNILRNRYSGTDALNTNYNHSASFINTVINAPDYNFLTWHNSNCWTYVTIGEGSVLNVKSLLTDASNSQSYVRLADGLVPTAYDVNEATATNFKAVKPEDVVTVTFTHNGNALGTREMARGVAPAFNASFTSDFYYVGSSYKIDLHDGWADENGKVTALLKDSDLQTVTLSANIVYQTVSYATYDSEGRMLSYYASPIIKDLEFLKIPANGTLRLYTDVNFSELEYAGPGTDPQSISFSNANATFDFNGYTLDMTAYYMRSGTTKTAGAFRFAGNGKTSTFKNGTLINNGTVFYMDSASTVYNFVGMTLQNTKADDGTLVDLRNGTVNMTDTNATCTGRLFSFGYRGGKQFANLTNTNITANYVCSTRPPKDNKNSATANITINGGELNIASLVYSDDITPSDDSTGLKADTVLNLTITDAKVSVQNAFALYKNFNETVTLSNCLFNKAPNSIHPSTEVVPNIVYGEGETLLTTDDPTYGYKVGKVTLPVSSNLTLYSDFNLNLFLGNNATKVMVGETELTLEEYDATKVKASLKSIAPNTAADNIVFAISYVDGGVTYTANFNYSVVKYATTLLAGGYSAESKALVASAVKYIDAAYAVAEAEKPATLTALTASANYTAAIATASDLAKGDIDGAGNYTALAVAINSAQLRLSEDYKYVLNLKETYTGTLKVNNVSYNVVNGTVNGKTYVTVTLRGYEFNDGLTVTATTAEGTVEGSYTLADYVEAMANGTDAELDALLVALYNFTVEAKEYNEYAKTNGLQ